MRNPGAYVAQRVWKNHDLLTTDIKQDCRVEDQNPFSHESLTIHAQVNMSHQPIGFAEAIDPELASEPIISSIGKIGHRESLEWLLTSGRLFIYE